MSALWQQSLVPQIDANGDPLVGAQVFFYNEGTLTPQTTYSDSGLSAVSTHDDDGAVVTDANGRFPAIFLNATPGTYRVRMLDPDGVVLFDVDGVSVPQDADFVPPDAGATSPELLFQTGDVKSRYGTGAHTGWVRLAGRTIGSATSGSTERANADCEDLFVFLWSADANLTVSGGRGLNAAADWAANKTIALPDARDRGLIGLGDMGNSDANRIADALVDSSSSNTTLGATVGASTHTLVTAEMPAHTHTFTGDALGTHAHTYGTTSTDGGGSSGRQGFGNTSNPSTSGVSAGTPSGTNANTGGDGAHMNVQPSMFITFYIKL